MSGNITEENDRKTKKLAEEDIVVGQGIIKAVDNDSAGTTWVIPGGQKTRSEFQAIKSATAINEAFKIKEQSQ